MKKFFLILSLLVLSFVDVKAAPGDTTWVQAHYGQWLSNYGDYDTSVVFPNGSTTYRRVFMYFTLGKYVCPGNPQFCSDWDYTVQTFVMTPAGDTFELGRLITPYANSSRMNASWKGVYAFDVTDYYPVLKNSATIRVHYSGYTGGFTADVKFAFIEGTPARNVTGVTRVWKNDYAYGHGSVAINDALDDVSLSAPSNTQSAEAKFTITGHGGDAQKCAEFCPNTYTMNLNGNQLVQQNFWKADCGSNNYYPQSGTWVFDRAGWCPGDKVLPYSHILTNISSGSNYQLSVTFPPYTSIPSSNGSLAVYTIECAVVYYGGLNRTLNATLEDIMAPSDNEAHFRMNPLVGRPTVKVRNTGSTAITSLKFEYGVEGKPQDIYTWSGNINSLEEIEISLPEPWELRIATGNGNRFVAKILEVNGQADEDPTDNKVISSFNSAPVWHPKTRISFRTNGSAVNGISETNWKIYDLFDNIVAQRSNNTTSTTYEDTLTLWPGVYRLEVTDAGCDGINWWYYPNYPQNPGTGYIMVRGFSNSIPRAMNGYYGGDFGCGFTQYFRTDWPTRIETTNAKEPGFRVFPNPGQHSITVSLTGIGNTEGTVQIIDAMGRVVLQNHFSGTIQEINVSDLTNGLYTLVYYHKNGKLQTQLSILK